MATSFQECVAMDLKFYNRNILLYLVDNATRLSSSDIIKSEKPNETEKILCALSNNIRTSGDAKYYTRDKMYYKRANDRQWKGPASVLGQDG